MYVITCLKRLYPPPLQALSSVRTPPPEASWSEVPRTRLPEDHGFPPLLAWPSVRTRLPEASLIKVSESKASRFEASKVRGAHLSLQFLLQSPRPLRGFLPLPYSPNLVFCEDEALFRTVTQHLPLQALVWNLIKIQDLLRIMMGYRAERHRGSARLYSSWSPMSASLVFPLPFFLQAWCPPLP